MSIVEMRKQVVWVYAGTHRNTPWEQKVKKMKDGQVIAMFKKFQSQGRL